MSGTPPSDAEAGASCAFAWAGMNAALAISESNTAQRVFWRKIIDHPPNQPVYFWTCGPKGF
jgi:hypothetical protein